MSSKVFFVGPGYVGREIIDLLLAEGKYEITALVRRKEAAEELEQDGIKTVIGDLNDSEVITKHVVESDVVFHVATADHLASAQAIIEGIGQRAGQGKRTIYLHQSGASVLSDASPGNNPNNKVYSDKTAEEVDSVKDSAPHRKIDLTLVQASKKYGDKGRIFIFMPPLIYGSNSKYKRLSIQVPTLTRYALKHGQCGYTRSADDVWTAVHVVDLAKAYIKVLHWAEEAPESDAGLQNPYFFCESGDVTWGGIASMIGKHLHQAGKISTADIKKIPESEYDDVFGEFTPNVVGCNAKNRADRLSALGWKPQELSVEAAYEKEELPILLEGSGSINPLVLS